ncbi:hypothetical protein Tco_0955082 [Tanacetum coccineum]|uniref:Uncharacterized protein n=1 Tax=Tanacetum coccineum TaxID=301880 RepID=A0ABQ5E664_9ASTR
MDDPNITMEDYIRLGEEKVLSRGTVYNWESAKYGKIWYDKDVHDLRSVETEFPAIVFNDELTSEVTPSCGPSVSPLNDNEIDFRISFDESDNEDYTVVYDENSFSYKIISVNNLKMDFENDTDKVNMPSFPSPKPKIADTAYRNPMGINTAYPWIRRIDFLYSFSLLYFNEYTGDGVALVFLCLIQEPSERNDNVGGVFINLEISKCWSLEISRRLFNTLFAQELKLKNHPEQNIRGVFSF